VTALVEYKRAPTEISPAVIAKVGRGLDLLLPYQKQLLQTTAVNSVTVVEKSRRTGYTWGVAADATLTAAAEKSAGGMDVLYIGYNLDMAREFIDTAGAWAKLVERGCSGREEFVFDDGSDHGIKAYRITFASGFEILALASRPRSLRGRQGYVIIDEAAFHDDLDEVLKAALALVMWGGKVLVISTHNGDENPFAVLVNDIRAGRKPYKLLRCSFDEALAQGLYRRICLVTGKPWSPAAEALWRAEIVGLYGSAADEELFCIPRAGGGAYIPRALIEKRTRADIPVLRLAFDDNFVHLSDQARHDEVEAWCEEHLLPLLSKLDLSLRSFLGLDFARKSDLSVQWPVQVRQDLVRDTPFVLELRNVPFKQQEQILYYICDRLPRFSGAALDAGGNGAALAEFAMQKYGSRIAQVLFSTEWYRENMPRYKAAFEDDMITLPRDKDIVDDHRAIVLDRGVAKVPDVRTTGADQGKRHGDAAIAGALAYFASLADLIDPEHHSSGQRRSGTGDFAEPLPQMDGAGQGRDLTGWMQ
jgi:phage FluMu gp28-like protein